MTNAIDERLLVVARALADCRGGDDDPAWHAEDAATILSALDAHDAEQARGMVTEDVARIAAEVRFAEIVRRYNNTLENAMQSLGIEAMRVAIEAIAPLLVSHVPMHAAVTDELVDRVAVHVEKGAYRELIRAALTYAAPLLVPRAARS